MIEILAAFALSASQSQEPPQLSLEQRMLARCSAAFSLVATGQENGNAAALRYPDVRTSGREFFVRSGARLMDETGMSREQLSATLSAEAQDLWDNDTLDEVMPACLSLLDQS
ncbi:hypothetical protein [Aurantiacibacter sp. D1-12]|uniref:hypothetical protein n=1 Tax=Aurantiacibacter sp. D1-12 TaxID=2993658 RepID=UPI00237CE5DA|nr:hypothetical protein [Aurantiacibacter sp. D1-12]MDE1467502.1 hypothetical protein [Aurantiacibacter sp. D1-12]